MLQRKITAYVLLLIISFSFTGCERLFSSLINKVVVTEGEFDSKNSNKKNQLKVDKTQLDDDVELSQFYDGIALFNAFDTLESEAQKKLYVAILEHADSFKNEKNESGFYTSPVFTVLNCHLTDREVAMIFEAVIEDNPQIFWFSDWYSYAIVEDYVVFELYFTMSQKEQQKCKKQLNSVVNNVLSGLKRGMSEFEVELYLHDYLVKNCVYDKKAEKNNNENAYSVYGALVEQRAVCQGYAEALQLLLSYVGINSFKELGKSEGSNHIWNVVNIGGDNYYVDVTWDDTKDYCMYDYFNITTKQLKKDHTISPLYKNCDDEKVVGENSINYNLISRKCTATKYNYYAKKGCRIKEVDDENMTKALVELANKGEDILHLYVDPDYLDFNEAYNYLFADETYNFVDYIYDANSQVENKFQPSIYVSKKKILNTITVELIYE